MRLAGAALLLSFSLAASLPAQEPTKNDLLLAIEKQLKAANETAGPSSEGTLAFVEGAPTEKLPGGKKFLEAYAKAAFKEPSEAYGPFAYVAANLVIDAIEAVGPDRAKVAARLKRTKNATTIIGPVEFDEYGQNTVSLISKYVSQDGKWVLWEDSEYASGRRALPGHKFKKM